MVLALLKAGFRENEVMEMTEDDAEEYLSIVNDLLSRSR